MAVQIACECGKRYRVAEESRGKRMRCKECGKELVVPRKEAEELDLAGLDLHEGAADDDDDDESELPPSVSRGKKVGSRAGQSSGARSLATLGTRRGRAASSSSGRFSTGDILIRSFGVLVFLATVANCIYQFQTGPRAADNRGPSLETMGWAILPVPIGGLLGLYIAYVGQEPDPEERRVNRIAGLVKCAIGVGAIILGAILTYVVTQFLNQLVQVTVIFTGLIFCGAAIIIYGGLSVLTGREFKLR